MRARELKGEERKRYVARSLEAYPWWEPYHRRAAPRTIPVIMLEPSSSRYFHLAPLTRTWHHL